MDDQRVPLRHPTREHAKADAGHRVPVQETHKLYEIEELGNVMETSGVKIAVNVCGWLRHWILNVASSTEQVK
jgi:hypothetical protein